MLTGVLVLYAIYLLCTVALVWAAVAVSRHIVRQRRASEARTEPPEESV